MVVKVRCTLDNFGRQQFCAALSNLEVAAVLWLGAKENLKKK